MAEGFRNDFIARPGDRMEQEFRGASNSGRRDSGNRQGRLNRPHRLSVTGGASKLIIGIRCPSSPRENGPISSAHPANETIASTEKKRPSLLWSA